MRCYLGKGFSIFFRSTGLLSSLTSTLNEVQHTNESFPTFSKFIGFLSSMNALISCGVQIFKEGISTLILYPFTKRVITTRSKLWKISTLFKSMILSYTTNSKLCFKLQVEKAVALKDSLISKEALFQFSQSLLFFCLYFIEAGCNLSPKSCCQSICSSSSQASSEQTSFPLLSPPSRVRLCASTEVHIQHDQFTTCSYFRATWTQGPD